jgi:hypothetical protein
VIHQVDRPGKDTAQENILDKEQRTKSRRRTSCDIRRRGGEGLPGEQGRSLRSAAAVKFFSMGTEITGVGSPGSTWPGPPSESVEDDQGPGAFSWNYIIYGVFLSGRNGKNNS